MLTQHEATAHSLYVLYEALPENSKQLFLIELMAKQAETVALSLKKDQPQENNVGNHFADICGMLKANKSVSLEEMEQAISQQGLDGFDDSH